MVSQSALLRRGQVGSWLPGLKEFLGHQGKHAPDRIQEPEAVQVSRQGEGDPGRKLLIRLPQDHCHRQPWKDPQGQGRVPGRLNFRPELPAGGQETGQIQAEPGFQGALGST